MAQVPRYFEQRADFGGAVDPGTAALPGQARMQLGSALTKIGADITDRAVRMRRALTTSERIAQAMTDAETWDVAQQSHEIVQNQDGTTTQRSRHDTLVPDWDAAWREISGRALEGVRDAKVRTDITTSLRDYATRKRISLQGRAQKWFVEDNLETLENTIRSAETLAAFSPEMEAQAFALVQAALAESEAVGAITPERRNRQMAEYQENVTFSRIKLRLLAGDVAGAHQELNDIREAALSGDRRAALGQDKYHALLSATLSAEDRLAAAAAKQRKLQQEAVALEAVIDDWTTADWEEIARTGVIDDLGLFLRIKPLLEAAHAERDDSEALKDFYMKFATVGVGASDLAYMRSRTTAGTFSALANITRQSSSEGVAELFSRDEYKQAMNLLEAGLRPAGILANLATDEQALLIPEAKAELALALQSRVAAGEVLTLSAMLEEARQIRDRYSDFVWGRQANWSARKAPPPKYKSDEEIDAAFRNRELGPPTSRAALDNLHEQRLRLYQWQMRQAIEESERTDREEATKKPAGRGVFDRIIPKLFDRGE